MLTEHTPPTFTNCPGEVPDISYQVPKRKRAHVLSVVKWYSIPNEAELTSNGRDVEIAVKNDNYNDVEMPKAIKSRGISSETRRDDFRAKIRGVNVGLDDEPRSFNPANVTGKTHGSWRQRGFTSMDIRVKPALGISDANFNAPVELDSGSESRRFPMSISRALKSDALS